MQIHTEIQNLPVFKNAVITIGSFDGVHTGHQQIIHQLLSEAEKINGEAVVITFHPHPKMVVNGNNDVRVLNTLDEKIILLEKFGIHHLVVVPFTSEFAQLSATEYIQNFLVANFHPHTIIIGYDHKFGAGRTGDYKLLESKAAENNYIVKEIPEHILKNITISSTKVRTALINGDINTANEFLGYDYFFSGKVNEGNKLGRTIGYPTANLQVEDENKLIPGNGVYVVSVQISNSSLTIDNSPFTIDHSPFTIHHGMMNIGIRPTIGGTKTVIEVNIFEFDEDIYGRELTVFIKQKLRDEKKFNGLEELKNQLTKDREDSVNWFNG